MRYLARAQAHNGLVVETQLFLFYGQSKLVLQFQPLPRSGIHAPVEHPGAPFAFLLGFVQRHIRVAQEGGRVGFIGFAERDTNARADIDLTNSQLHGSLHHFVDPVGDFDHIVDIRDAVQNDGELVPAEPGWGIGGTQTG